MNFFIAIRRLQSIFNLCLAAFFMIASHLRKTPPPLAHNQPRGRLPLLEIPPRLMGNGAARNECVRLVSISVLGSSFASTHIFWTNAGTFADGATSQRPPARDAKQPVAPYCPRQAVLGPHRPRHKARVPPRPRHLVGPGRRRAWQGLDSQVRGC